MTVLMLGWEFPPVLSGGLGVATYGIVNALRHKTTLRLIVPHNDLSELLHNVDIVGLNNISSSEISEEHLRFDLQNLLCEVRQIPLTISPYHHINRQLHHRQVKEKTSTAEDLKTERLQQFFSGTELYGPDILQKVYLFTELATRLAVQHPFDIIHAHDWVTFGAAIKIKTQTQKPLVLHVHALETDRSGPESRNEIYWMEKNSLSLADSIIAVSNYTKHEIIKHYDIPESKIVVIHNGIDQKSTPHKDHKISDKIVVFLGRITHQKGPQFLLETAAKVVKVYPKVKFVVAGTGDEFAHLLEGAAHQRLGNKFIFAGFLSKEKVDEILSLADVYFMPSLSEPFGLSAAEAAQHFVPGVLSNHAGVTEVLTSSLTADFWDTDKYANYIYALLKYPQLRSALAKKSHEEISSLSWESTAEKIFEEYKKIATVNCID